MAQLRPAVMEAEFVSQVIRQQESGYQLVYLEVEPEIKAVAGYRFSECLAWGRFCYIDDLVTDQNSQSQGYGRALFDWIASRAQKAGCKELHLDSGVQRFAAHAFYKARGMRITSHHFAMQLAAE